MRNLKMKKHTDRNGRATCTTWIFPEVWQAIRIAAAKTNKPVYQVIEDALRRHPPIKREMEASDARE